MSFIRNVTAEKRAGSIFIEGESDCNRVSVQLTSIGSTAVIVGVDTNTQRWNYTFTSAEIPNIDTVPCPTVSKHDIFCVEDPAIRYPYPDVDITYEGSICPSVTIISTNISGCDNNGQRTVTFEVSVNNAPNPTIVEILYGDGGNDNITNSEILASAGNPIIKYHPYDSGSYTVVANIVYPEGCQSSSPITVVVDPCLVECPDINWSANISEDCVNGQRTVTVSATIVFASISINAALLNSLGQIIDGDYILDTQ